MKRRRQARYATVHAGTIKGPNPKFVAAVKRATGSEPPKKAVEFLTNRPPTHPGEILLEEFVLPQLAEVIEIDKEQLRRLLFDRTKEVSAWNALKLAKAFDTTPEFWMNLNAAFELHRWRLSEDHARERTKRNIFRRKRR